MNKSKKTKTKLINISGKRKKAIARAIVKKGTGNIKINKKPLNVYEPEIARMRIKEAVIIAGKEAEKVDILTTVSGGGWSAQAEAVRLTVAKGILEFTKSAELKKKYLEYDRNLLVADTRYKETRKPLTHSRARAKRQKSYR